MTHEQIHAELVALCGPIVKAYRDDLLVHDLDNIKRHDPNVPFLHFSRGTGTYMVHLIAASEYPAKGVYVPFLFGTAEREHLLDGAAGMVDHCTNYCNGKHVCHYWNGKKLLPISLGKARQIASEYAHTIRQQWAYGVNGTPDVTAYVALGM